MTDQNLADKLDKLWITWKIENKLPQNDEMAYLNQMWFFYWIKQELLK
jgi:hypothetical protein